MGAEGEARWVVAGERQVPAVIAVLRLPIGEPYRVVLPTAPIPGDVIEVAGTPWRVTDRRFVVPMAGESEVVLTVEGVT